MRPHARLARLLALVALVALVVVACSPGQSAGPAGTPGERTVRPAPSGSASGPATTAGPTDTAGPLDLDGLAVTLEPFVAVAGGPLAMAAPRDGSGRLFVAAQDGTIWVVEDGAVGDVPAADLGDRVRSGGEQGLLGIATHPRFPADPRIFVNYTDEAGDTIVASLSVDPDDPGRIDTGTHRQLLFIDQPYGNHNGGAVLFGPDGYLYVFTGDGGSGGDPHDHGQRLDTLLGKVLRLDVDATAGDQGYILPDDNPFLAGDGRDEIWHLGLRNPWRASFDRLTGDLWIGDVGQGAWEEIDVARAGASGLNFGWNRMEGAHCFRGEGCNRDGLTLPVTEYGRELGCTVIGGYVYRGSRYPELAGAYLFADYCRGRIFAIDSTASEFVPPIEIGAAAGNVAAFGEDADGELYLLTLDGAVSRVVAARG